ncbi:MAG: aspartate aminotransferase family protein [Fibrobacterota bacterium]
MSTVKNELFVDTYGRGGMPLMDHGSGVYLYDSTGKEYLDFVSGIAVNALGYGHPAVVGAIKTQAQRLVHCSNLFSNQPQIDLAQALVGTSFADRVFFCNSGTEANEAAIKFARKTAQERDPSKTGILSFHNCFHGRTYGAMTATAQRKFHQGFDPIPTGYYYAPLNDIKETRRVLESAEFSAIIIEPIQGEGGLESASREFLGFLRQYCDDTGTALIFDEIQCGMGRTGFLWAYEIFGVVPDILTCAKPLGGGLPLGAVLAKDDFVRAVKPGDHGTTFGGNPVACAAGKAVVDTVSTEQFLQQVQSRGEYLQHSLRALCRDHDAVVSVCGKGLLSGIRLSHDPGQIIVAAREKGLLLAKAGNNTIRFMPPLIVDEEHVDRAVEIIGGVFSGK